MRLEHLTAILALGLVTGCAAHVASTPVPAPAPGAKIRYAHRASPGQFTVGRLVSIDTASLVFERFEPGWSGRRGQWVARSLATDSLAQLQVRTGRRSNALRGMFIGIGVGFGLGLLGAAGSGDGWFDPSPGEYIVAGLLGGGGYGLLIGALIRSDVWSPVIMPPVRPPPLPQTPPVAAGP